MLPNSASQVVPVNVLVGSVIATQLVKGTNNNQWCAETVSSIDTVLVVQSVATWLFDESSVLITRWTAREKMKTTKRHIKEVFENVPERTNNN